jgi:hypothetical protein
MNTAEFIDTPLAQKELEFSNSIMAVNQATSPCTRARLIEILHSAERSDNCFDLIYGGGT